jgi:hypothetical protein
VAVRPFAGASAFPVSRFRCISTGAFSDGLKRGLDEPIILLDNTPCRVLSSEAHRVMCVAPEQLSLPEGVAAREAQLSVRVCGRVLSVPMTLRRLPRAEDIICTIKAGPIQIVRFAFVRSPAGSVASLRCFARIPAGTQLRVRLWRGRPSTDLVDDRVVRVVENGFAIDFEPHAGPWSSGLYSVTVDPVLDEEGMLILRRGGFGSGEDLSVTGYCSMD